MVCPNRETFKDEIRSELEDPKTRLQFFLLNVYAPFYDRSYWETLNKVGALDHDNLILAGDLNLTLTAGEVWGQNARMDTLANYFNSLFEQKKLL